MLNESALVRLLKPWSFRRGSGLTNVLSRSGGGGPRLRGRDYAAIGTRGPNQPRAWRRKAAVAPPGTGTGTSVVISVTTSGNIRHYLPMPRLGPKLRRFLINSTGRYP